MGIIVLTLFRIGVRIEGVHEKCLEQCLRRVSTTWVIVIVRFSMGKSQHHRVCALLYMSHCTHPYKSHDITNRVTDTDRS